MFYSIAKRIYQFAVSMYYRVSVINPENMPEEGAAIVHANHNNFFIDGMCLVTTNSRIVRVIIAKQSLSTLLVEWFAKAMNSINVARAIDVVKQTSPGRIKALRSDILEGHKTEFRKFTVGTTLYLEKGRQFKVKSVRSNFQLEVEGSHKDQQNINETFNFKIKPNHEQTYEAVWTALKDGDCVGIFPQGLNQQVPKLQPLKAGICTMALGAMEKYGIPVKLVPVAFHYFKQHKFRSQIIMEFGEAYQVPQNIFEAYKSDKKTGVSLLLELVEQRLRSMTLEFAEYDEIPTLLLARQIYTLNSQRELTCAQKLQLNRRFAKGFVTARANPDHEETYSKLVDFSDFLKKHNVSVRSSLNTTDTLGIWLMLVMSVFRAAFWALAILPGLILWGPTSKLIDYMVETERCYWKERSTTKQNCHQLVSGYRMFLSTALMPLTYIGITILMYPLFRMLSISSLWLPGAVALLLLELCYANLFIDCLDRLTSQWRQIRFLHMRLFDNLAFLRFQQFKRELKRQVRTIVESVGPEVLDNFENTRIISKTHLMEE